MHKIIISMCSIVLALLFVVSPQQAFAAVTGTLLPVGDGAYTSWTPKNGVTHYTMVDEAGCNGNTDYLAEALVGERDSFRVSLVSIPTSSVITNITLTPCASRSTSGAGSATMNVFYRLNGVNSADAGGYALAGTVPTSLAATSFSGLSFTKNATSTLEVGAVYSAGTKGARLSRLATVITYTPPTVPNTPSNLTSFATTSTALLFWSDNSSNELGFTVERGLDGVAFTLIGTANVNTPMYTDTTVVSGTTYYYRVRAYNAVGSSGYSSTTVVTVP